MNTRTRRLHFRELETLLRELDAATSTNLDAGADPRAEALLDRVLESRGATMSREGSRSPSTKGRVVRRSLAVTAVAVLIGVGSIALPNYFGGSQALAWSATPQTLTAAQAREAQQACDAHVRDSEANMTGTDLSGLRPVITELRGSLVLVHETDSKPAPSSVTCYVRNGRVVAAGGGAATAQSEPLPPLATDSLHGDLGAVYSTPAGSIRGVTGGVGSDVVAVVLDTVAKGPVTATVRGGHFAAWWPDAPTNEAQENALTAPEITGAIVTLRDGTSRRVTVEELSGRTSEELARQDTGGSAGSG